jgi:DNA segregation ATPase FtsK/SpoIIIE, S-DNA-T family
MTFASVRALLKAVPVAKTIDEIPFCLPIEGQHWFIAGRTGSGKNSWTWSLVLMLALAWMVGLVRFWGLDPKRIELSIGRGWWDYYANTDEGMVELLEQCVDDMHDRMDDMQGVRRAFVPSPETPLNVIIIDEMAYLSYYMADKRLKERADKAIRTILTQGRAPGYAVVGAVQDPRIETCGYRNMFPLRIACGLNEARQVDMVLGEGAHDAGALSEQLPSGREGAGVAYVLDAENMNAPLMLRAPWCDDATINRVLEQAMAGRSRYQRRAVNTDELKMDDLSNQPGWAGQSAQQWQYRVE